VGNGMNTLFWSDRWLHGCSIVDLAPLVTACVPPQIKNRCTVAQALDDDAWLSDIQGGLSLIGFMEFLRLGNCLREVTLSQDEDQHIWRFDALESYSSKSAYRAFFNGSATFEPWRWIWKCWAPDKCNFFIWLAIQNRCWTADRHAHKGMSHPEKCHLCDQEEETI
jgi:hypothetical protein